jgi:ABC-2 type transport system ATP-binding protein
MRVDVHGLGRRFGPIQALEDVSFSLESSRKAALIGPNGSGKSTLNRVLMGLLAHSGRVHLDGHCPLQERAVIAKQLAYVPQIAPQLGAPVADLVLAIERLRGLAPGEVQTVASAFDLDLRGLAALPFRSLSGGTKQKLLISLALASRASFLIFDEPTASLDSRSRERFFELFEALVPRATLLLCSHRLEEIRPLVDHVLMLQDGRLVYDGPLQPIFERCARATIDVWIRGEEASAWLLARGFRHTAAGAWQRTVDAAEKMKLLSEITDGLGSALINLNARDLEAIEVASAAPQAPHA